MSAMFDRHFIATPLPCENSIECRTVTTNRMWIDNKLFMSYLCGKTNRMQDLQEEIIFNFFFYPSPSASPDKKM